VTFNGLSQHKDRHSAAVILALGKVSTDPDLYTTPRHLVKVYLYCFVDL
jgi:hypothetical protein